MDLFSFNFLDPEEEKPAPKRRAKALPEEERIRTVGQLLKETRETLEHGFSKVWVKGEISNFKAHPSGHQYFTLKDGAGQLSCVVWRSAVGGLAVKMRDGMEVQVCGDVTVYEARGQLQMTVRRVQQSGEGMLQAKFEALKRKLAEEGLFDSSLKKSLPAYPENIAIITASSGAALRDMLQVLQRRAPWIHVFIYPVAVQGSGSAVQIAQAIRYLSEPHTGLPPLDVLVVARGGGSLEDLWSFNEEDVARALAACPLPTISAVGHEVDFTIADFVADLRAPTPSAAAELLAPDRAELAVTLSRWRQALQHRMRQIVLHHTRVLELLGAAQLQKLVERALGDRQQAMDEMRQKLQQQVTQHLHFTLVDLQSLRFRLAQHSPAAELQRRRTQLANLGEKFEASRRQRFSKLRERLVHLHQLIESLSPQATMARGYSLTTSSDGHVLKSVRQLKQGDELITKFSDGTVHSRITIPGGNV